jgi:hypothetical protein
MVVRMTVVMGEYLARSTYTALREYPSMGIYVGVDGHDEYICCRLPPVVDSLWRCVEYGRVRVYD